MAKPFCAHTQDCALWRFLPPSRHTAILLPFRPAGYGATSDIAIGGCSGIRLIFRCVKLAVDLATAVWRRFRLTQSIDPER